LKFGTLSLLETSEPVQDCNGFVFLFHLLRLIEIILISILYGNPCARTQAVLLQYLS